MKLYLVRHGRQCNPRCNVDVELAAEGICQAELLGKRLKQSCHIDAVYSSSLLRARQTAKILGDILEIPPFPGISAFDEIDFGDLTGHTDEEISQQFGDFMKRRSRMAEDLSFPNGECGQEVWNRAYPKLQQLGANGAGEIVIVTHGGVIRSVVAGMLHMEQRYKLAIARNLENCSMTVLQYYEKSGEFTVETVNDYAHLEQHPELLRSAFSRK